MSDFRIKAIIICFLFTLVLQGTAFAQLKRVTTPNMISEPAIYVNSKGKRYSTGITFEFKKDIINLPRDVVRASVSQISLPEVQHFLNTIRQKYGNFTLIKEVPSAVWGDTVRINRRTGKTVYIKDMSQYFRLKFSEIVPVDSIANVLARLPGVAYAQGPVEKYLTASPNDPFYQNSDYRWAFDVIDAEQAWDITKGSSNIRIDINDDFDNLGQLHEDLAGKVVYRYSSTASGGHGNTVAGVAGAATNNNLDVASLGWKTSIMFNSTAFFDTSQVASAVTNGADIINFSWVTTSYQPDLATAIDNALKQGLVCVASAGNGVIAPPPKVLYPAAYNFGSDG